MISMEHAQNVVNLCVGVVVFVINAKIRMKKTLDNVTLI